MRLSLKEFALITTLLGGFAAAQQVSTGTPQFASFGGGPFDGVNLGNLNVHFAIPVVHKAGRGIPFSFDLAYDSSIWTPTTSNGITQWTPIPNFGWQTGSPFGYITYPASSWTCTYIPPPPAPQNPILAYTVYQYQNWTFVDRSGTTHPFTLANPGYTSSWNGATVPNTTCSTVPDTYPSGSGTSTDGTGYSISITNATTPIVTSRNGAQVGQTTFTDTNGNKISSNNSGQYFDTLSSTLPVLTVSGTAPSPTTFTYTAPSGTQASYIMYYVNYTVETAMGFGADSGPIREYGPLAKYLVDHIQLQDGTKYTFSYEAGPTGCVLQNGTSSCVTGRIVSVTLPTGGTITYTYIGGQHGTGINRDGSTAGLTRMLSPTTSCAGTNPSGCWQYLRSLTGGTPGPGSTWTTTVTDPVGNQSVINFAEDGTTTTSTTTATYSMFETQRKVYQGQISSNNCSTAVPTNCLLSTIVTTYDKLNTPIGYKQVTKQSPDSTGFQSYVGVWFNNSGLPSIIRTWGASQLQQTSISYASLGNNIVDRPSSVYVSDASNNLLSQTTYSYDESSYPVQPSTSTPQHTSISGSRGNATTITYYTAASTTLSKHFQYYDTGTLYRSWDVNGSSTSYTSYFYDTTLQSNGNYTNSCGNSFATKVTSPPTPNEPSGMSGLTSWNCTGAVATSSTDPNGNSVSTTYSDPYFWRAASAKDQLLNTTSFLYTPASGSIPASVESRMPFNGTTSISEQLTTLDPFGRVLISQQEESPTSTKYDSTQVTYDTLGRPYQTSMPYVGTAGQGTTTAAETTASYDALGRVTLVQDGQSSPAGYVQYSYNLNDVLQINGPAPSGESLKQKQTEYDALGRLISVCEITAGTSIYSSGNCGQQTALPSPPGSGYLTTYTYDTTTINSVVYLRMSVVQNAQSSTNQQNRQYVKDLLGRLIQETNPETTNSGLPGITNYTYDTDSSGVCPGPYYGDLVKKVDNRGNTTCYTYDSLHRVQTITYTSGSPDYANSAAKTFVYDVASYNSTSMSNAIGRLAEAYTGPSSSKTTDEFFSYSVRGELTEVYEHTLNSGTPYYHSSAGYWANGAVSSLSLVSPANVLPSQTFGLEGKGRPSSVTSTQSQNSNVVTSTNYNLNTYRTTVTFGSGDSDLYTMSPTTGRLTNYTFKVGTTSDVGALTWNKNGSLASLRITDTVPGTTDSQTCSYKHDDMVRIASVNCGNSIWRQNFSYDPFGNIDKDSTGYTGLTFNPSYSIATNQFTSLGAPTTVYDEDGRIKYDGVNHYTWDADSMLHTVDTSPGTTVTYDALGRMVEKQVGTTYTQVVYSPLGSKLAVTNGQTLQKGFVPLPAGSTAVYTSSGLAYYRHSDHLGSSRLSTTPNKTLYSATAYAPFGEQYAQSGTIDNSYAGDDQDTVAQTTPNVPGGMFDTLMRKQMPVHGRWLSPDPAGLGAVDPSNPQTWNRYAYVMNNPMSLIDPFGEDCYSAGSPGSQDCGAGGSLMWQDMGGVFSDPFSVFNIPVTSGNVGDVEGVGQEWGVGMMQFQFDPQGPNLPPFTPVMPQPPPICNQNIQNAMQRAWSMQWAANMQVSAYSQREATFGVAILGPGSYQTGPVRLADPGGRASISDPVAGAAWFAFHTHWGQNPQVAWPSTPQNHIAEGIADTTSAVVGMLDIYVISQYGLSLAPGDGGASVMLEQGSNFPQWFKNLQAQCKQH